MYILLDTHQSKLKLTLNAPFRHRRVAWAHNNNRRHGAVTTAGVAIISSHPSRRVHAALAACRAVAPSPCGARACPEKSTLNPDGSV